MEIFFPIKNLRARLPKFMRLRVISRQLLTDFSNFWQNNSNIIVFYLLKKLSSLPKCQDNGFHAKCNKCMPCIKYRLQKNINNKTENPKRRGSRTQSNPFYSEVNTHTCLQARTFLLLFGVEYNIFGFLSALKGSCPYILKMG